MLWALSAIVVLVVSLICASEFSSIAKEKGYTSSKYFWYAFLFGIFGALIVIALPDRKAKTEKIVVADPSPSFAPNKATISIQKEAPVPASDQTSKTSGINKTESIPENPVVPESLGDELIKCPHCGSVQKNNRITCYRCGAQFIK